MRIPRHDCRVQLPFLPMDLDMAAAQALVADEQTIIEGEREQAVSLSG